MRCKICDVSPGGPPSLYRVGLASNWSSRLYEDPKTGDILCDECLGHDDDIDIEGIYLSVDKEAPLSHYKDVTSLLNEDDEDEV